MFNKHALLNPRWTLVDNIECDDLFVVAWKNYATFCFDCPDFIRNWLKSCPLQRGCVELQNKK